MPPFRHTVHYSLDHTPNVLRHEGVAPRHSKTPVPSVVEKQRRTGAMRNNSGDSPVVSAGHSELADKLVRKWAYSRNPYSPVQEMARAAKCSERTAENWWSGNGGPNKEHLLRLMAAWPPKFAAAVIRLVQPEIADAVELAARTEKLTRDFEKLKGEMERFSKRG